MSERGYTEIIGALRELRPSEDLSLLHSYELRRVFEAETVTRLGLVERTEIRASESFRAISAPLPAETPDLPPAAIRDRSTAPYVEARGETRRTREPERLPVPDAPREAEPARRDWLLQPEPIPAPAEAQPYGDDPLRMRELVQWFADGRAASSAVLVQRAAGDLLEGAPPGDERPIRFAPVNAAERRG